MKKLAILLIAAIAMQSCYRSSLGSTTTGMWTGATLGGAIGGLMGGHRGHHLGTVVGVIAGAAAGAVAANNAERRYDEYVENYNSSSRNRSHKNSRRVEDVSYDSREGSHDYSSSVASTPSQKSSPLVLRNLRFVDDGGNQTINRNEDCKIIFELSNPTSETLYDVIPAVYEVDGNSHINLSPSTRIEVVKPGDVVRYTCSLRSDGKIKVGAMKFRISVAYAESDFITLREFSLPTAK